MIRITDAATELADLVAHMSEKDYGDNVSLLAGICSYGNFNSSNYDTIAAISELNKRFFLLRKFVSHVDDDMLDDTTRKSLCGSIDTLHSLVDANNFHSPWNHLFKKERVGPHIIAFRLLARTVRHHEPIKRVEPEEIDRLRAAVQESINEARASDDLDDWERALLLRGLDRALFLIDHFNFFGHDAFLSYLVELRFQAEVIVNAGTRNGKPDRRFLALGAFLLLASEVLIRPAEIMQALDTYKTAYSALFAAPIPQLAPPLKQIEGPRSRSAGDGHDKA
jgi:hypothetical protein